MHVAQSGIFAPRDGSHSSLEFGLLEQADPGALVQAIANLRKPHTTTPVVIFLVSFGLHQRYQWGQWRRLEENLAAIFPSQEQGVERAEP